MSVIIISKGSYSHGGIVAEKVAQRLGFECIGRDILLEISKEFNVPELKLIRAIDDAPSFLERFTFGREKYIAYIKPRFWAIYPKTTWFTMVLPVTFLLKIFLMCLQFESLPIRKNG